MTDISHEQARQYVQASQDDLLNMDERRLLEEHLKDCPSCQGYRAELERVGQSVQQALHDRWDGQRHLAQMPVPYIQSQGRTIAMKNRFVAGLKLAGSVVLFLALALAAAYIITLQQGRPIFNIPALQVNHVPRIVFATGEPGGDIYTVGIDGSGLTNLTNSTAFDGAPVWSPDGTKIAFASDRNGIGNIFVMDADGGNVSQLTDSPTMTVEPAWSPDGTRIAYISGDWTTMKMNIYVMDADGQNSRAIVENSAFSTLQPDTWSPDSQYIAYGIDPQVFRVEVSTGSTEAVTPPGDPGVLIDYAWSKDGSSLMYLAPCSPDHSCITLHSVQVVGTEDRVLSQWQVPDLCPSSVPCRTGHWIRWSPDGTEIMFLFNTDDTGWIYLANTDGSDFKALTNYPILGNPPKDALFTGNWSPDGKSIVFISALDTPDTTSLYTIEVEQALNDPSTRPTRLTPQMLLQPIGADPQWQP